MLDRIHEARRNGRTIHLYHLFSAFALDIVSEYALGKDLSTNLINNPDFGKAWAEITGAARLNNFGRHFKGIMAVLMSLPESIIVRLNPPIGRFLDWRNTLSKQVQQVLDEQSSETPKDEPTTLFRELIKSDLPAEEKTLRRLTDEANMVLGAGGETTAQTLTRTFYHLIENPQIVEKLRAELTVAIPEPDKIPPLAVLQNLVYLNAVVDEGVRISFPVPARSPRVFRDHTLHYGNWTIRPGVSTATCIRVSAKVRPRLPSPCRLGWS
jgi:cytochrome P450